MVLSSCPREASLHIHLYPFVLPCPWVPRLVHRPAHLRNALMISHHQSHSHASNSERRLCTQGSTLLNQTRLLRIASTSRTPYPITRDRRIQLHNPLSAICWLHIHAPNTSLSTTPRSAKSFVIVSSINANNPWRLSCLPSPENSRLRAT